MRLEVLKEVMYYDGPVLFLAQDIDSHDVMWFEFWDESEKDERIFRAFPLSPRAIDGEIVYKEVPESQIEWVSSES